MLPYNYKRGIYLMKKFWLKFLIITSIIICFTAILYLFGLPKLISDQKFINFIENSVAKNMNAELVIRNPYLKTSIKPEIQFSIDNLSLKKDGEVLLNLQTIDTKLNFYKIFKRKITLEKLGADDIYVNVNKLQDLKIKKEKKKKDKKSFFGFECYHTLFYIKDLTILYTTPQEVKMKLLARGLEVSDSREPKMLHFKVFLDLDHNQEHLKIFFKDKNNVYFKDRKLHADNFRFKINNSDVMVNFLLDEKNHFDLNLDSDKFEIDNVRRFLNTDLLIPNGHEFVSCFKDFTGDFNFRFNLTEKGLNGNLNINEVGAKLIPLANIPLKITRGTISLNPQDIELKGFEGYYGTNKKNTIKAEGTVKDYTKTAQTQIDVNGIVYDEFAKYISKIAGMKINIINHADTNFRINFANSTPIDILGNVKVPKGSDVLFEGASISPVKYLREFDIDMNLFKENLSINNIDYHIAETGKNIKPLITVNAKVNVFKGILNELGFYIPEPLPSEFFNVLIGQKLFRRGTFAGNLKFINNDKPYLDGEMNLKDTIVVGQGIFIRNLNVKTDENLVKISSEGSIRRARYKFKADVLNKMLFPVIVQNADMSFDEIDAEKVIQSFAPRPQRQGQTISANRPKIEIAKSNISSEYFDIDEKNDLTQNNSAEMPTINFQPNLIEIKKGVLNVKKGIYKTMSFGNLNADITLDKHGILDVKSNRFDFTEGISTLKLNCDLAKQKYNIRLGTKDVDTDAIATSILNLNKEISGHAKALIELYTDETMKLNGKIQFEVNDGKIAKLGLIQYILNMASVFRNPLVMISPSSVYDIVNIPDGEFKKINGTLVIENNSIKRMMIQSSSPQLSSFIVGRINLENMDASLRIYTKFNDNKKGVFGFLRDFSLNSLSQKANLYIKGNTESYYSAELSMLPPLETGEKTAKVFLTKFDGDLQSANFISSLKKIK